MFVKSLEVEMRRFMQESQEDKNTSEFNQLIQQLRSHVNAIITSADLLKADGNSWSDDKKQECLQVLQIAVEQINGLMYTADQKSEQSTSKIN